MFYRLKQLIKAVHPKVTEQEYLWLKERLHDKAYSLFTRQHLAEQRHALDVYFQISKYRNVLPQDDYETLMYAALFHDCGKSLIKIQLWQRIFIVLSHKIPSVIQKRITTGKNTFARTMVIYSSHPSWGKHLAAKAGFNERVQKTIEFHHHPDSYLEKLLYEADQNQ